MIGQGANSVAQGVRVGGAATRRRFAGEVCFRSGTVLYAVFGREVKKVVKSGRSGTRVGSEITMV